MPRFPHLRVNFRRTPPHLVTVTTSEWRIILGSVFLPSIPLLQGGGGTPKVNLILESFQDGRAKQLAAEVCSGRGGGGGGGQSAKLLRLKLNLLVLERE